MCRVKECVGVVKAFGLCQKHYFRARRHGDPNVVTITPPDAAPEDRLKFYGWDVTKNGCWEWRGPRHKFGYGRVSAGDSVRLAAHRVAYETWVGPIPGGQVVRHKCDNPPCINPDHLETGTSADNTQDMMKRGRFTRVYGERANGSKLTSEQVLGVIRRRGEGESVKSIASSLGVVEATVRNILAGRSWKELTGL
jgi:hypothetical protein